MAEARVTAAGDRARGLARVAALQAEMVKLAEWKLAAAMQRLDGLDEEKRLLAALVGGEEALGASLARAALRTAATLDRRRGAAAAEVAALRQDLDRLRRRDHAVAKLTREAGAVARREAEAAQLGETVEAWLARASLP